MVRIMQVDKNFDKAAEKEANKSHLNKADDDFFQCIVDIVFQSGLRGAVANGKA